ncbi:MAG TPA: hypothetical protein VFF48_02550 [Brevundimonas sp.]|nr:hypothetical protein [Brevundimonas sp.]
MKMRASIMTLLAAAGLAAGGCTESRVQLSPDLGVRLNSALVAQVADPDAVYADAATTDGSRVALAQNRYRTGTVIRPVVTDTTNTVRSTSGAPAPR